MKRIQLRLVCVATGLISLTVLYGLLWARMIASPRERTGTDFLGFYAAARIAQAQGSGAIYDAGRQQALEQEQVGFDLVPGQVLLFNHLPYFIPVLTWIVTHDYVASFLRWTVILLMLLLLDAVLFARLLPAGQFTRGDKWLAAAGFVLFFPTFTSLMNGQETVFVLLGLLLWMAGIFDKKDWLAGLGLSLVTIRPQLALILAAPFLLLLFKRRWIGAWFLAGCAVLGLYSLLLLGGNGVRSLVEFLLISGRGEWYGLHLQDMPSLTGIFHRLAPSLDAGLVQAISLGGYLLAILGLSVYFWKHPDIGERQVGLAVLVSLLFVPYLHFHDVAILIVPMVCVMRRIALERLAPSRNLVLLPLIASFLLLAGFVAFPVRYPLTYLIMLILGIGLLPAERLKTWASKFTRKESV